MKPTSSPADVRILADGEALRRAAADEILRVATDVLRTRKIFTLALSGGRTPRGLYQLLAGEGDLTYRKRMPWTQLHLFWSDERPVPADSPESNYGMVREALLSKVSLTRKQIHRIRTEGMNAAQAAHEHQRELKAFFGEQLMVRYEIPRFDLIMVGLGADGHVAGLFPKSDAIRERRLLVSAPKVDKPEKQRITLTPPVLNMASNVMFLVSGKDKAAAVQAALEEPQDPDARPAQIVHPSDGRLTWLVDREAGSLLKTG